MLKSHLPYLGRYESFSSWDSRCKEWERNRDFYRKCQNAGHGSQKYDREILPKYLNKNKDIVILSCWSRLTKFEEWLTFNTPKEFKGRICGHSLYSSHTYNTISQSFYDAAKFFWNKKLQIAPIQEVIEQTWKNLDF